MFLNEPNNNNNNKLKLLSEWEINSINLII